MNFDFSLDNKLSSDFILSKVSEESIMYFYLGVNITNKLFCSPIRKDRHPTCSFFRNSKNKLIYKDFATSQYLDCWSVVMTLYNCSYKDALRIVANDFRIIEDPYIRKNKGKIKTNIPKLEEKEFSKIQVEIQEFSDLEVKWWARYGITPEILKRFNVFSCKHVFLNDKLVAKSQQHCPIYGYYGKKYHGQELWRCYFPKRTSFRFLTNWPTKKIQGYDQLPKEGKVLVITKSMKDVLCLYSMGITAIAPNSETQFLSNNVLEDLKKRFKYIIVLFDNDQTGISFMNKIKKEHPELIYTWIPRKYGAKDISDFYKMYKKKETINLINKFITWLSKNRENWI